MTTDSKNNRKNWAWSWCSRTEVWVTTTPCTLSSSKQHILNLMANRRGNIENCVNVVNTNLILKKDVPHG